MNLHNNDYTILANLSFYAVMYGLCAYEPFNGKCYC